MALSARDAAAPVESSTLRIRWSLIAVVCLGVWLHAADTLVTTTVMPSAIPEIGGLPFVYWTIALYELGSIVAGAMTGLAAVRFGLRDAMCVAALMYAFGCAASALAPSMAVMLGARLMQGLGGGAMLALSYIGVTVLFPAELWPRVLAVVSGVWGVSSLAGPLVGGALASVGLWRGAFWAFAAQAVILLLLTPLFIDRGATPTQHDAIPGRQIVALTIGVLAITAAGVQTDIGFMAGLIAFGLIALALVLQFERNARQRLFPPTPFSFAVGWGPGFVMVATLATASVSFTVYGPLLLAKLFAVTPFVAGLMVAVESVAWTLAAIAFAGAGERSEPALIRVGALLVAGAVGGLAVTMPHGPVWALVPWLALQGAGFGMCWAFLVRRIVAGVPTAERERASAAVPTLQLLGYAVGAAMSGIVANALGLVDGASPDVVRAVAFWVFAAFLPLTVVGVVAAWRATAR